MAPRTASLWKRQTAPSLRPPQRLWPLPRLRLPLRLRQPLPPLRPQRPPLPVPEDFVKHGESS